MDPRKPSFASLGPTILTAVAVAFDISSPFVLRLCQPIC
jgi:hypothetical protein